MTDETMPFAEVVQATDTCHLWTGGVCVRHCISAIGDKGMDNDAAAINAAHESRCQSREKSGAVKGAVWALRVAKDFQLPESAKRRIDDLIEAVKAGKEVPQWE